MFCVSFGWQCLQLERTSSSTEIFAHFVVCLRLAEFFRQYCGCCFLCLRMGCLRKCCPDRFWFGIFLQHYDCRSSNGDLDSLVITKLLQGGSDRLDQFICSCDANNVNLIHSFFVALLSEAVEFQ